MLKDYAVQVWYEDLGRYTWNGLIVQARSVDDAARIARRLIGGEIVCRLAEPVAQYGGVYVYQAMFDAGDESVSATSTLIV